MNRVYAGESRIEGKGVFVNEDVRKGDIICDIDGEIKEREIKSESGSRKFANWIGMGKNLWLNPNKTIFRYLNHSCDPSVAITGTKTLVALRDMKKGDEVTFDYSLTDTDMYWEMECHCGSEKCRHIIRPIYSLPTEVFANHYPHIPEYFQKEFMKHHIESENK